ncbi:hypothetical protein CAL7716_043970 [Calothrix sp. PCC 7716]|nr:hypothetical protein CAL7716_043970 [Calothrix sp. PCC 7716]
MKLAIDIGHNCPPDTGAIGIKHECKLTKELGLLLISELNKIPSIKAINVTPDKASTVRESLNLRVINANRIKADYYISLHFNAFNKRANGTEIFAISQDGKRLAKAILSDICKLGYVNRGVKNGSHLHVLRNTKMPAILIEVCFIDSSLDMSIYKTREMVEAIIDGLITFFALDI